MNTWGSYPKIWNLGHPAIDDLFEDPVIIEEKVDGSQFSFGRFLDELEKPYLRIRSKGAEQVVDAPEKMFAQAVETAQFLFPSLVTGWTYRAEYLAKPKHNVLAYERVPERNLILFDVCTGAETYLDRAAKEAEAARLGLEVVPVLYRGVIETAEQLRALFETPSILGGQKIEGVVIKNYSRFGRDGHVLLGKFVSEAFKEVHKGDWREQNPTNNDILARLVARYRTPARWAKAVQHLREAGKLENSPRDIGALMKEAQSDVEVEAVAEIVEMLLKWAFPHVRRGVTAGLPEWYKEELLKQQFEQEARP